MTDHTLSSLRRRARQTGSIEDRAALLRVQLRHAPVCDRCGGYGMPSRVRGTGERYSTGEPACASCAGTGSPLRARVDLAAWCGDEAARAALGRDVEDCRDCGGTGNEHHACCDPECCPEGPGDECGTCEGRGMGAPAPLPFDRWLSGLSRWSDLHPRAPGWVLVRAAVAAARAAEDFWRAGLPDSDEEGGAHADEQSGAVDESLAAAEAWLDDPTDDARWTAWHVSYVEAGHLAWLPVPTSARETAASAQDAIRSAARLAGEQPIREAICKALVAFALEDA